MSDNIDDIIKNLPADALTPEAAKVLGRTESAQEAPVQEAPEAPTVGGRKTFKRKDGRKHRRKSHKKNKRRSSKRKQ